MNKFSCWCYAGNLVWVVQLAMVYGRHTIKQIREEQANIADYHLDLQFENDEQLNTFVTNARAFHKIITKE